MNNTEETNPPIFSGIKIGTNDRVEGDLLWNNGMPIIVIQVNRSYIGIQDTGQGKHWHIETPAFRVIKDSIFQLPVKSIESEEAKLSTVNAFIFSYVAKNTQYISLEEFNSCERFDIFEKHIEKAFEEFATLSIEREQDLCNQRLDELSLHYEAKIVEAIERERQKIEQFIQDRVNLFPDNDDLPLSQRGSLDAYINCLKMLKTPE